MTQIDSTYTQKASILLIALWAICLLTVFAVSLGYTVRQKLSLAKRLNARDTLRLTLEGGIEKALGELKHEPPKSFDSLIDQWSTNPAAFQGIRVGDGICDISYSAVDPKTLQPTARFGLIDEERKINVNRADMPTLTRLFRAVLDYDPVQAQELAASLIDWRDEDSALSIPLGSAEDSYYRNTDFPYESKDAPFEVMEELLLVKGMDRTVWEKLQEYLTVYGNGKVNLNTASRPVLLAIGFNESMADKILAYRNGKDGLPQTEDDYAFMSVGDIVAALSQTFNFSPSEIAVMNAVVDQYGAVSSEYFLIRAVATLNNRKDIAQALCVANRLGQIARWKE